MKRWWIYNVVIALIFGTYSCVFPDHTQSHHEIELFPYVKPHPKEVRPRYEYPHFNPHYYEEINPPYEPPVKPHYEEVKPPFKIQPKPKPEEIKPPMKVQPIQPKPKYEEIKPSNIKPQPKEVKPPQKPQYDDEDVKPSNKKPYEEGMKLPPMKPRQ